MKKAMIAVFALVAMVFGISAGAAPLTKNFNTSDNRVIQVEHILSIESGSNVVFIRQMSGSVHQFADTGNALFNKVLALPDFNSRFIRIPGTNRYMATTISSEILCLSGQTVFSYFSAPAEYLNDGCQTHALVKASSN